MRILVVPALNSRITLSRSSGRMPPWMDVHLCPSVSKTLPAETHTMQGGPGEKGEVL